MNIKQVIAEKQLGGLSLDEQRLVEGNNLLNKDINIVKFIKKAISKQMVCTL